jgi:hypothetical protein
VSKEEEYKKLRAYLNKSIRGANVDAILKSVASGPLHLVQNVEAVNDSLYIVSAQGRYLDQRTADKGLTRPPEVGLSDDVYRDIAIEVTNRKQVRDLILQLLRVVYGESFTRATSPSSAFGPYSLENNDSLIIKFDGTDPVQVTFFQDQFQDIAAATAQEVADAITRSISRAGRKGSAFVEISEAGEKVVLISDSDGTSSSVQVLGGKAQNILRFEEIRQTTADSSTQWQVSQQPGGRIRFTWVGGVGPGIGKVFKNDYVNIYGNSFDILNRGTYTVVEAVGGEINQSYFEIENPNGINETVTSNSASAILFYNPKTRTILSNEKYATVFQTTPRTLEIFLPATTRVVRRDRRGAAHVQDGQPSVEPDQFGPYVYDLTQPFTIGEQNTSTTERIDFSTRNIIPVANSSEFPDGQGRIILGYGTSKQEGPIQYIGRPSTQNLQINPAYRFKFTHEAGTDITIIDSNSPVNIDKDASDYAFYLTDSVVGRIYIQNLIKEVAATGIILIFYILYPGDEGLGKWGDQRNSDKYYIWGTNEDLQKRDRQ